MRDWQVAKGIGHYTDALQGMQNMNTALPTMLGTTVNYLGAPEGSRTFTAVDLGR